MAQQPSLSASVRAQDISRIGPLGYGVASLELPLPARH
jgi:hypothetical protein